MARIRSLKPEFWEDEEIGLLSRDARLLYMACWNAADDEGLMRWTSPYLKACAFMYDDELTTGDVELLMKELADAGFVLPYRGGKSQQQLGWIPSFRKHQKPNRPQPSKLPAPSLQNPDVKRAYAERDGWCCGICGEQIPEQGFKLNPYDIQGEVIERALGIDHIHPRVRGGSDYPSNIQASHRSCNSGKRDRVPDTELFSELDTEEDTERNTAVGVSSGGARAVPPPQDFAIDDALRTWAAEKHPGIDLDRELEKWLIWCLAEGRTYKNPRAGFQTWVGRAKPTMPLTNGHAQSRYIGPSVPAICPECKALSIDCLCGATIHDFGRTA